MRPPRLLANGLSTPQVNLGIGYSATQFSDFGPQADYGVAVSGYGMPTTGTYSLLNLGQYHTFGTLGQGSKNAGLKEIGSEDCMTREMIVTLYAKDDMGSAKASFEVGSYAFES